MGGTLSVESAIGRGSRFRAEIPVAVLDREGVALSADRQRVVTLAPGQPQYRVLIVDDEPENWMILQRLLRRAGFLVQVAHNGAEALIASSIGIRT